MKSKRSELSIFAAILLCAACLSACSSSKSDSQKVAADSTRPWGPTIATAELPQFGVSIASAKEGSLFAIASINETTQGRVYVADSAGNVVRLLADGPLKAGNLRFRLLTSSLPEASYLFVLEAKGKKWTQAFVIKK
jgi:hypothetical protein